MNGRIARVVAGALLAAIGLVVATSGAPSVDAAEVTTTSSYSGPSVPIPDGTGFSGDFPGDPATAGIEVSGIQGQVIDVDLLIGGSQCSANVDEDAGIDHGFVGDLEITLVSPNGTEVLLADNAGGSGNNFCQTLFDDDAGAPSIQLAGPLLNPFTGTWTPANDLAAFDGIADANGTWTLQVQDFIGQEVGDIQAFSVIITTETTNDMQAIKTVSGDFVEGGQVVYEVALSNAGSADSLDNPGDEFVDVLPDGLELVSSTATAGSVSSDLAGDTVTWNGSVAAGGTVTITIQATIAPGTVDTLISNQGTVNVDADVDGVNDTVVFTDDVAGGTVDPTSFTVAPLPTIVMQAVKTVSGDFVEGGQVVYQVVVSNAGNTAALDNPGDEFVDVLPDGLELVSATATAGSASSDLASDTVLWNGSVAAGGSVTITITATIAPGTAETVISNQGTLAFDADLDGVSESTVLTDNAAGDTTDPTALTVAGLPPTTTSTTPPSTTTTTAAVVPDTIPRTGGQSTATQVALALGLVLIGGGLVFVATRRPRGNHFTRT